jgi:RNA polymerase sigma-70 factor, ECF subfamily
MALLSSLSATVQEPSEVRFAYQSGKLVRPRLVPMLRVVDGGGGSEPHEQSGGQDCSVEPAIPPHGDEAAMRDLMRSTGTPRTDPLADLAARATHGDVLAMRELLRSVANSLLAAVRAVVGRNAPDVEDIAQETMVAFVQALPAFRGECSVNHYVSRIAVRTAVAARKRRIVRENRADSLEDDGTSEPYAASPGDEAWAARRRSALRSLLDELPEVQAETFALRTALGYSMQEVAAATGAPVNTVRSRLRLAKEALRRRIEQDPALAEVLGGES